MLTFAEYTINKIPVTNFSKTFKQLINQPDTYEKLKLLEKKIKEYTGNKSNIVYRLAVYEYNKLKKIETKLLREKKNRIRNKYSDDDELIDNKNIPLNINLRDLESMVSDLYASYIDTKAFRKKCKILKPILNKFLSNFKANGDDKLFKKYYSVYIDVCEYLISNFSDLTRRLNVIKSNKD